MYLFQLVQHSLNNALHFSYLFFLYFQNINELLNQSGSSETTIVVSNVPTSKAAPAWEEVKSEDGSSYYWNTVTNGIE